MGRKYVIGPICEGPPLRSFLCSQNSKNMNSLVAALYLPRSTVSTLLHHFNGDTFGDRNAACFLGDQSSFPS